jgi:hypothetical protein
MNSWHFACRGALVAAAGCAFFSFSCVRAEPVKLAAGTEIPLTLQHHVTSGYIAADQPVYFRVTHDVQVDGRTVIAGGTLVRGKMLSAQSRHSRTVGVDVVRRQPAAGRRWLDGRRRCRPARGRSRVVTVAWTIFWGSGPDHERVNPYLSAALKSRQRCWATH